MPPTDDYFRNRDAVLSRIEDLQALLLHSGNPADVFSAMLQTVNELTDSEFGFIGEIHRDDEDVPYLRTRAISDVAWDADTREMYRRLGPDKFEFRNLQTLFGAVIRTGRLLISNEPASHSEAGGTPSGHPVLRSFCGIPLKSADRMIGMIGIANRPDGYDRGLLEEIRPLINMCAASLLLVGKVGPGGDVHRRLSEEEALRTGVLTASEDALLILDSRGTIQRGSPTAEALLDSSERALRGRCLADLVLEEGSEALQADVQRFLRDMSSDDPRRPCEVLLKTAQGDPTPTRMWITETSSYFGRKYVVVLRDLRETRRRDDALQEAHSRLTGMLDACRHIGIIALNPAGLVQFVNPGAEQLLGRSQPDLFPDNHLSVLYDPADLQRFAEEHKLGESTPDGVINHLLLTAESECTDRREWVLQHPDGKPRFAEQTVSAVRNGKGELSGFIVVCVDMTARRNAEAELQQNRRGAEEASEAKSQILANISHEIRTPMAGVIGTLELVLDTTLTEEQLELVETAHGSATSLLEMLNAILDYARNDSHRIELELAPWSLQKVLRIGLAGLQMKARQKGVALKFTLAPEVPDVLMLDSTRIRQVVGNLVSNAVKFTDHGVVSVEVQLTAKRRDTYYIRFRVSDTGIGIPQASLERIFTPFTQSDASTVRKFGGTGLGLTIAQQLVQIMGGELKVESRINEGSIFYFEIPLRVPSEEETGKTEQPPAASKAVAESNGTVDEGLEVLLAEDHPVNQLFTTTMLKKSGHRVTLAEDGKKALDAFCRGEFDIVLMDIQMPVMDGLESTRKIREHEAAHNAPSTPIIALTANAMGDFEAVCRSAGMDAFLTKPLRTDKLRALITELVPHESRKSVDAASSEQTADTRKAGGDEAAATEVRGEENTVVDAAEAVSASNKPEAAELNDNDGPASGTESSDTDSPRYVDVERILECVDHDEEAATRLVAIFRDSIPSSLEALEASLSEQNYEVLERTAHSLKSPLDFVGAASVRQQALELERAADRRAPVDECDRILSDLRELLEVVGQEIDNCPLKTVE